MESMKLLEKSKSSKSSINQRLSGFFSKHLIASKSAFALGFACLVLIFFMPIFQTDPPNFEMTLIGQKIVMSPRGEKPETRKYTIEKDGILQAGDFLKVRLETNKEAYVYVILHYDHDEITALPSIRAKAGEILSIPKENRGIALDRYTTKADIHILISAEKIENFEKKIADLKKAGIKHLEKIFPDVVIESSSFRYGS